MVFDDKSRRHGNRDQLIRELSERLLAGRESGDLTGMLDTAVPSLTRDLAETLTRDAAAPEGIEALSVLAAVHWVRYQLLPEGQNQDDLQACLKWSAALLPVAPDLVPEPMRARWPAPA